MSDKLNVKNVIFALVFLLVSLSSQASVIKAIDSKLQSKFSCQDREIEELCYLSFDRRDDELLIYMSSSASRHEKFIEKESSYDAADFAHKLYWSITAKVDEFRNQVPDDKATSDLQLDEHIKVILVLQIIYQDDRIIFIHDEDNTAHIELNNRFDTYPLLKEHRVRVKEASNNTLTNEILEKGQYSFTKYQTTTIYDVASAAATKNMETGEVTRLEEYGEPVRQVSYTKTIFYMVLFPKDDNPL